MTRNNHGNECKIADPCVKCMHGALHPPLLATYDEERGDYALATEHVCMARWASTNTQHGAGSICGLPVLRPAGEFDLCEHHYWRFVDWRYWDRPRDDGQPGEFRARVAASFLIAAGADEGLADRWIAAGKRRRAQADLPPFGMGALVRRD